MQKLDWQEVLEGATDDINTNIDKKLQSSDDESTPTCVIDTIVADKQS